MGDKIVLVTGVTGRQGGAAARYLLKNGWRVRGLTRNTKTSKSVSLKGLGVEMVQGDMEKQETLRSAMEGVYGVFSVQNYWEKGIGYEGEVRQGVNLVTAAKKAGVQHFVQTSIASVDEVPECMHWKSKRDIEAMVREAGLPATMLRSVFYMDNFIDPQFGPVLMLRAVLGCLKSNTRFHMIATDDIGALAAHVFNHPERFVDKHWDIAGDVLTKSEMAQIYAEITGNPVPKMPLPLFMMKLMNREMANQFEANNKGVWSFPIKPIRNVYPELMTWKDFCLKYVVGWRKDKEA
ncbi:MAG TPA: NmrA/HSCARG family protein [Bacillales bacterium]|nr:NmrA/HSCARG family protein [Bacillales bacterium]